MNSTHNNSLTGKVAIVTGGSKGIGAATVLHLVSLGANVVFSYSSDSAAADDLEAKIKSQYHPSSGGNNSPPRALAFKGDASSIPDIEALVAKTLQTYSRIDILILNAALGTVFEIADADEATFDTMMSVNIKGPFFLTKHVAPHLSAGSHIIFLSSALTVVSGVLPHQVVYMATKGAIEQMARVLAKDFGRRGINVNVISPGPTATELFYRGKREALVERIRGTIPMGKIGTPEEVAEVIGWLAVDGFLDKTLGQMAEWRSFGCKV